MNILILDTSFNIVSVIDSFTAFIWTTRYKDVNEFELHIPPATTDLSKVVKDNYVLIPDSDRAMIIETRNMSDSEEEGDSLVVSGRGLESILDRRIVWTRTVIEGNLQNGIKKLITENAISPTDPNRKLPGFTFKDSTDPKITSLTIEPTEFLGEDLLTVVKTLCEVYDIGFRVLLYEDGEMEFSLYAGVDRSYSQSENDYVVFSPSYDNLFGSRFYESNQTSKNVILASADVDGENPKFVEISNKENLSGLDRREMYSEVSGIETYDDSGEQISDSEYLRRMAVKGAEELAEYPVTVAFEGEIEAYRQFIYNRDFFLGDIVQVVNKYGMESRSRIDEVVLSEDSSGRALYPTFVAVEDENEESEV